MIGLSTRIYDLQGARVFREEELDPAALMENYRRTRRVTRTATLDGGASVYDTGYAVGDRDVTIKVPAAPKSVADYMAYIVKTYAEIAVVVAESAFIGVPEEFHMESDGAAVMKIKLTEEIGG